MSEPEGLIRGGVCSRPHLAWQGAFTRLTLSNSQIISVGKMEAAQWLSWYFNSKVFINASKQWFKKKFTIILISFFWPSDFTLPDVFVLGDLMLKETSHDTVTGYAAIPVTGIDANTTTKLVVASTL